ncbi:MAG: preprotein translocase subunit SecG [Spartobacteria bacterium]|nr:preprotein translocase subunit SecG [Spartobacteria bacterium]
MEILRYILIIVEVLCSLLLIGLVLLQKTKSEGLGLAFGSGMGETLFGSRAGNVLSKATVTLTIVFLLNTILLAVVHSGARSRSLMDQYSGGASAPARQAAPQQRPQSPAPSQASGPGRVAPTLPGVSLDDAPMPVAAPPAQVEVPIPEPAPAAAQPAPQPAAAPVEAPAP